MWTLTLSSIYYDCRIINSEVEYSIIMESSEIIDVGTRIGNFSISVGSSYGFPPPRE